MRASEMHDEVVIRGVADDRDFEAIVAVQAACRETDGLDSARSAAQVRDGMGTMPEVRWEEQFRLALVAGEAVGYAIGFADGEDAEEGRVLWHDGLVLPAWRGRGIGRRLLAEGQLAARRHGDRRFGPATGRVRFRSMANEVADATGRLLRRDGYAVVRYTFSMVRPSLADLPSTDLPPGIEVRPAARETAMQILRAADEAFRDHWGFTDLTDEDRAAWIDDPVMGQLDVWQVAWDGDEVAGGVLGFINEAENASLGRQRGYTEVIFTRRPWRGRGLATALIARNLQLLAERGMTEAALSVDAENPTGALALYRKMGFEVRKTRLVHEREA
jgi:GNAT superfamily N-acetyltransferase